MPLPPPGLSPDDPSVAHVVFYGLDTDEGGTPYAASIPLHKARTSRVEERGCGVGKGGGALGSASNTALYRNAFKP